MPYPARARYASDKFTARQEENEDDCGRNARIRRGDAAAVQTAVYNATNDSVRCSYHDVGKLRITKRRKVKFKLSVKTLNEIRPKLQFPSLEGSLDLCGLLASHNSDDEIKLGLDIWAFRMRVAKAMLAWMGALPAEAVARVQLASGGTCHSDEEKLVRGLMNAAMASMRDDLIELKVWVTVFHEINNYLSKFRASKLLSMLTWEFTARLIEYDKDLKERHSKLHFCTLALKSSRHRCIACITLLK
ncbi:hypothetical protein B0H16DRAFT_1446323 [Mycena metata]|uniref:Uncharacterized protein n=1 Tax=Mycena metata TaxID=1033252 RepID=A0AAD7KJ27_9AGAR|nr:hypothetical protein B0H16DRAFT_1446323 [Mycena metata]